MNAEPTVNSETEAERDRRCNRPGQGDGQASGDRPRRQKVGVVESAALTGDLTPTRMAPAIPTDLEGVPQ